MVSSKGAVLEIIDGGTASKELMLIETGEEEKGVGEEDTPGGKNKINHRMKHFNWET